MLTRKMIAMKMSGTIWFSVVVVAIAVMIGYYVWTVKKETSVAPPEPRVVTGITYAEEDPSAVVGYDIVHEGDTIRGVKVVKIYRDKVEFEKDDKRWTQEVREKPNRAWPKMD